MERSTNDSALAPVLGAKRDGRSGKETSRSLLMTVLGEFVMPNGGSAWTKTLVAALELHGIRDKSARQVLARMEGRGWLERDRVGRQTRWRLSELATSVLSPGADRIYGFGRDRRTWDDRWLVLLASVPESDRPARYRMTQQLGWAGFGSLGQGMWISPWTETETAVAQVLRDLEIDGTIFRSEIGTLGSPTRLAATAWDLPAIAVAYDDFLSWSSSIAPTSDEVDAQRLTELVHRWRRFPLLDPELPSDLLPTDWPGPTAVDAFATLRRALLPGAERWWTAAESTNSPAGWTNEG